MAAVSLPSIHEMFPAHLMRRDHLNVTSNEVLRPRPSTSSPTLSSPTCSIAECQCSSASSSTLSSPTASSSTKVPPHSRAAYSHPHTHSAAQHLSPSASSYRPFSRDGGRRPISSANTSRHSIFSGAQSHLQAQVHPPHAHAQTPVPGPSSEGAPPRACPSSSSSSGEAHHPQEGRSPYLSAHPYPYPNSSHERERRPSYAPPPPSHHRPPHPRERLQHAMDTTDGDEDDASEGSIGGSPMPSNLNSPTLQMQMQARQGVPPHIVPAHPIQTYTPGMSVIPLSTPVFEEAASGKKHVCPTCFKRFNRPSSLRIHFNTHTGATPFRCPYPNCGREFSVNSNMRRHYRNHASGSSSTASTASSSSSSTSNPNPDPTNDPRPMTNHPAIPPPPRGGLSDASHGPRPGPSLPSISTQPRTEMPQDDSRKRKCPHTENGNTNGPSWDVPNPNQAARRRNLNWRQPEGGEEEDDDDGEEVEVDELAEESEVEEMDDDRPPAPRYRQLGELESDSAALSRPRAFSAASSSPVPSPSPSSSSSPALSAFGAHSSQSSHSPQSSASSVSSSSPSVSPSEAKPVPLYSPSSPYSLSVADARVSTVLRPAFGQVVGPGGTRSR